MAYYTLPSLRLGDRILMEGEVRALREYESGVAVSIYFKEANWTADLDLMEIGQCRVLSRRCLTKEEAERLLSEKLGESVEIN